MEKRLRLLRFEQETEGSLPVVGALRSAPSGLAWRPVVDRQDTLAPKVAPDLALVLPPLSRSPTPPVRPGTLLAT